MKKIVLFFLVPFLGQAQLFNNSNIHINEGAVLTVNTDIINNGTIKSVGTVYLRKNLNNQGEAKVANLVIDGNAQQLFKGTTELSVGSLELQNNLSTNMPVVVTEQLQLSKGIIETTSGSFVAIADNATVTSASNSSHVKGLVKKTGNEAFVFPVGDGTKLREFSVSKPSTNDEITVGFVSQNPTILSNKLSNGLQSIASPSYWSVASASGGQPIGIAMRDNDNEGQIVSLKNNTWEAAQTSTRSGVLSSTVILTGVNYFTVGVKSVSVEASEVAALRVYPNPSTGSFEIVLVGFADSEHISLDVLDMSGKILNNQSGKVGELNTIYTLGNEIVDGSYVVRVLRTEKQQSLSQKLVIRR